MASEATMTIIKMLETLPEQARDRVVERLREYIEDIRDEELWNDSFSRTQATLVAAAQQVRKEIADGKATPMDIDKL